MQQELSASFCSKLMGKLKKKKLNIPRPYYMIHKHTTKKRVHYDLRLESEGVLKSWAIPKQPSSDVRTKRLAIQVEDHALEYGTWHGIIPEGNYGAGSVEIWDHGSYETIEQSMNKWVINIKGRKLKGIFCLIKFKDKNWLFFKKKD